MKTVIHSKDVTDVRDYLEGVDYTVEKTPNFHQFQNQFLPIPDSFSNRRMDTGEVLGVVGSRYQILDHREGIIKSLDAIKNFSQDFSVYHQAWNGKIWTKVLMHDRKLPFSDSNLEYTVTIKNGYDGLTVFGLEVGFFRLVCSNGLIIGKADISVSRKHTLSLQSDKIIEHLDGQIQRQGENMKMFTDNLRSRPAIAWNDPTLEKMGKGLVKDAEEKATEEISFSKGNSLWAQYNAFTNVLSRADIAESRRHDLMLQVYTHFSAIVGM